MSKHDSLGNEEKGRFAKFPARIGEQTIVRLALYPVVQTVKVFGDTGT